ncbi:Crp/Fnr family transcriptional regulator [Pedobacter miscanthi]|uniref:Crp/Fnr family transcriptional regulator n=1 Tax=Pedobacter miscanthi TaxID=2259170 RepID=A0A366L7S6_9SPHI|nr:Crp/Fnr family transcriptional regulator [Pedobacter miscanthi]RBQ09927.1 hypothetical protein DRW42_05650 [Pedobacter miscanthi]
MDVAYIKYFYKVFLPLLDRVKDRAALRFLYRHTAFFTIQKGKPLFRPNSTAANGSIIIIADGLVNGFLLNKDAEQANIWLGKPGSIYICDDFSFTDHTFNLLAIEDTVVLIIDKKELEEGCNWYPSLDSLFNFYLLRNAMADANNRNILFRMQNIENKTRLFRRMYPGLSERIPAELLLSYLEPHLALRSEHDIQLDEIFNEKLIHKPWSLMLKETYFG